MSWRVRASSHVENLCPGQRRELGLKMVHDVDPAQTMEALVQLVSSGNAVRIATVKHDPMEGVQWVFLLTKISTSWG